MIDAPGDIVRSPFHLIDMPFVFRIKFPVVIMRLVFTMAVAINNVHGEVEKFACNVCSRIFGSKSGLNSHIESYHQKGQKKLNVILVENLSLHQDI